jgi:PAS domain S-box-containing protein
MASRLGSIRRRFVATAAVLALVLLGTALYAQRLFSDSVRLTREIVEEHGDFRRQISALKAPLRGAESLLYRYAIRLDERQQRLVRSQFQRIHARASALLTYPLVRRHVALQQTVQILQGTLRALDREAGHLMEVVGDAHLRYPAMGLLTERLVPINEHFSGALARAIDEANGLAGRDPDQAEVLRLLQDLRYYWLQQISAFRVYVANRSGVFGEPGTASRRAKANRDTFASGVGKLLDRLAELDSEGRLGFELSLMLDDLIDWRRQRERYVAQATAIYESDRWRADLPLLNEHIRPLLDQAWSGLSEVEDQLDHYTAQNVLRSRDTSQTLSLFIWAFVGFVHLALVIAYLLFELRVRRPMLAVAQAMDAEARNDSRVPLGPSRIEEVEVLRSAFDRMQQQVRSRQVRIESILANAGEGIVTIDESGSVESFNKAAERAFGHPAEDVIGRNVATLMPEPHASAHDGYLARYLHTGEAHILGRRRELTAKRRDGGLFPIELSVSEMRLDEGRLFIGIIHDVTERRQAEEQLHQAKTAAEQATLETGRKNRELLDTVERLQETQDQLVEAEKMASLAGLVAGVAHEINTPVGIGVTAASHLQQRIQDLGAQLRDKTMKRSDLERFLASAQEGSQIILGNLQRAADLVHSFKQVAADQTSDTRRRFRLKEYLEEILLSLRPKLKNTRHEVLLDCPDDLEVDSYPGSFSQVLTNLILNSLTHAYGVDQTGTLSIRVTRNAHDLRLVYADDGRGIPAGHRGRIFEPFFTTRRGQGGSGLGLHIVYNVVKQHLGGDIRCESHSGEGTTFTLDIPGAVV